MEDDAGPASPVGHAAAVLETHGLVGLLSTLEAMMKTSDVELVNIQKIGGGFLVMGIVGHIAEVRAAVDAGLLEAAKYGGTRFAQVYPRPHERTSEILRDPLSSPS